MLYSFLLLLLPSLILAQTFNITANMSLSTTQLDRITNLSSTFIPTQAGWTALNFGTVFEFTIDIGLISRTANSSCAIPVIDEATFNSTAPKYSCNVYDRGAKVTILVDYTFLQN